MNGCPGTVGRNRSRYRIAGFGLLLFLSGFCGISYEILYARILSNFVGDQFAVSASVLITFLAGIGFGSLFAHRLWRWLWLIEALVGLCAVTFAACADSIGPWVASAPILQGGLGASILLCVLLLCVPSFLIGCSLPLFGGYLERLGTARAFHKAYAVYNFGAALTVLVVEFWLLRLLGIRATVLTMAALNGSTSLALAAGFPEFRRERPAPPQAARFEANVLIALALASVASAVFQLLMVKLAECMLGPFRETFALVIALVLLGIAVGSALVERWRFDFAQVALAGLAGLAWIVGGLGFVAYAHAALHESAAASYLTTVLLKFGTIGALMGIPAAAFGATIPALLRARGDLARDSGRLLFISSSANVVGFLLMAFALHRYLDYGVLTLVVAGIACASVLAYQEFRAVPALWAVGLLLLAIALHPIRWDEDLLYIDSMNFESVQSLERARHELGSVERFKGNQDVFSLVEKGDTVNFFVNGYVSVALGSTTEPLVGVLPALLAPRTDRAMVLGLGSGMTAGAVGLLFDRTDAVEINPAVVENLWRMKRWNFDIESMPNVHIVADDGMHFLRASTEKYTLIINTVPSPLFFSAAKLYTKEFFDAVRERLTPDGLYVTWVDSDVGDRGLDIILKSLRGTFRESWLFGLRSQYFLLVCSTEPIGLRQARRVAENTTLAAHFFDQAGMPAEWLPYALLHTHAFDLIGDASVPINTFDAPALEFEVTRARESGIDGFLQRLVSNLNDVEVRSALDRGMTYDAMNHALFIEMLMGSSEIHHRWEKLIAPRFAHFPGENTRAMLQHLAGWALFANTAAAHREYAWFLSANGHPDAAIVEYRKALVLRPKSIAFRLELASTYERSGDLDAAVREYATILERYPGDPLSSLRMGRIAVRRGRFEEALPFLGTAASYYERSAEVFHALGEAQEGLGLRETARRSFERALALDPTNREIAGALERARAPE